MPQNKPWEKYGSAPGGLAPIPVSAPDPTQPYRGPTAAADLAAKRQEAELRRIAIEKARRDLGNTPDPAAVAPSGGVSGDAYLKSLPPADAQLVKGIASGKIQLPANAMRSPYWQKMLGYVVNYDPQFDGINYNSRAATRKDFTSGKAAANIRALNTAIGHVGVLFGQIDGTYGTGGYPFATTVNAIGNRLSRSAGSSGVTNYEQTAGAVASELTQVFRGSGGAEADVKRYLEELNSSGSADQKRAAAKNIMGLLKSRLDALGDQYTQGMGTTAEPLRLLDPEAQKMFNAISGVSGPGAPGGGAAGGGGGAGPTPTIRPPGGGGGGPAPYAGNGPMPDLSASDSTGATVIGNGYNAVPNPEGQALYKQYLGLWAANASDNTIRKWSQKVYAQNANAMQDVEAALKARSQGKKINFYPSDGLLTKNVPANGGVMGTIADTAASPFGTFAANAGNQVGAGIPQYLAGKASGNRDLTDIRFDTMNAQNPNAAVLGQLTGGAGGALLGEGLAGRIISKLPFVYKGMQGAERAAAIAPWGARGGDALYGGVSGATSNPDNPLIGGTEGAAFGLGGGMAGRGVTRAVGNSLTGVTNSGVNYLNRAGIPLTFGQTVSGSGFLGKAIKGTEDAFTSLPVVGDILAYARNRGIKKFNNAAFKEALGPITKDVPPTIREQGIEMGLGKVGDAFDNALNGQNITIPLGRNDPFMQAVTAGAGSKTGSDQFIDVLGRNIAPIANKGTISGREFQQLDRSIDGYTRKFDTLANGTPVVPAQPGYEPVAGAFRSMSGAMDDAVRTSNPALVPQYDAAKSAFRNTMILKDAVNRARGGGASGESGVFMPSQLSDAAAANSRIFGGTQGTTNQPFFELTRAAQNIMPSKLADSGTARRLAVNGALFGAGGGAYAYGGEDAQGAAGDTAMTLGGLSLAMSPAGQRILRAMVLKRPDFVRRLGTTTLNNAAPYGGMFGAPIALQQIQGN